MISIELISKGESSLQSVLESIKNQTFKDYEIVCADSSNDNNVKTLLLKYNCKVIELPNDSGHLVARYNAHKYASGERSLILDSTRPLKNNALECEKEVWQHCYRKHSCTEWCILSNIPEHGQSCCFLLCIRSPLLQY